MQKHSLVVFALALLAPLRPATPPSLTPAQRAHEQVLFRRIFGERIAAFDPAAVAKVKRLPPGERLKLDTDGDGKIDTIYFIDTDPKHQPEFRPILVKVIDQDGDMDRDGDGDLDSDLYLADWHADGTINAAIEYRDTDHDNGVDEMGIYTYSANNARLGTDAIHVWWSRDMAGTHQLWETVNYRYQQPECQFRTAFGGDEIFSIYVFDSEKGRWIPSWEDPFAFYDEDGDHLAEVAIRFSGSGDRMESMRYSFDADNDTDGDNVHDYDFSFSCLAAGHSVTIPRALMETVHLRGGPVEPLLSWKNARRFGESAGWGKVQLTWVENDNNIDSHPGGDPHERWEGVIASGTKDFPQVGGPPVGIFNSRYEADLDNSGKMKLYYSPEDRRIHLRGAEKGSLQVDYNYDGKLDMDFEYRDTDHDGIFDTWTVDVDGDGVPDRTVHIPHPRPQPVPLHYRSLTAFYNRSLDQALAENKALIDAMKNILPPDAIESYYTNRLTAKIRDSRVGTRYYQDLIRERYFVSLKKALEGRPELWSHLEAEYNAGNFSQAAKLVTAAFPSHRTQTADFTKWLPVYVSNPSASARMSEPIVLDISTIRKQAPDFNPNNFVVRTETAWIAPRELPSQVDLGQIAFVADLRANEKTKYRICYSPANERKNDIRQRSSIYRGIRYTKNSVRIQSSGAFSLAFTKFPNDKYFFDPASGYFASWGRQDNIVQEVGQAVIFTNHATLKETATRRELIFKAKPGEAITYYLISDRRRDRMFPIAPTADNWHNEIRALAARLHTPVSLYVGQVGNLQPIGNRFEP